MVKINKNESGFSMLELSVAIAIAGIIAVVGVTASTVFINSSKDESLLYKLNAEESVLNAEKGYLEVVNGFWAKVISDLEGVMYSAETNNTGFGFMFDGEFWVNTPIPLEFLQGFLINDGSNPDLTGEVLAPGHAIMFDGVNWINATMPIPTITDLVDVQLPASPTAGDIFVYDGVNWVSQTQPSPALSNLTNVTLSTATYGDSLIWDGTQWVNGVSGIPGEMMLFPSSSAPAGWLIADGRAVSRTAYSQLFSVIGTTYGAGDGSTTFNLPDFRGRAPVGFNSGDGDFNTMGRTGGAKTHTLTSNEMPSHSHSQNSHGHSASVSNGDAHGHNASSVSDGGHSHSIPSQGSGAGTGSVSTSTLNVSVSSSVSYASGNAGDGGAHSHSTGTTAGDHSHGFSSGSATASNNSTGGDAAHNNLQPYIVMHFIIKF